MSLPDTLSSNSRSLSEQLKRQIDNLRSRIVRANYNTKFAQTAPQLGAFRAEIAGNIVQLDNDTLSESFRKTVPLTTYESYAPFLARFFDAGCKASAITDLLVPGIPDFIGQSSSTSGGLPKMIPKYNRFPRLGSSRTTNLTVPYSPKTHTRAYVHCLACDQVVVKDEDNRPVSTIYLSTEPAITVRTLLRLDPEKDDEKMASFILDHAAPYAASFIKRWRSFLLVHALFAVGNRYLEAIEMVFISTFVELIRHLDEEFDTVVSCIAQGTIPELDGIDKVRYHLESNFFPDPERAEELRRIGRPSARPGWCGIVWPNLRSVNAVSSGSFALYIPLARWFLGPDTDIRAHGYGSTESIIGFPYSLLELNQFKLVDEQLLEFLDVTKSDSIDGLVQAWEVEVGRRYEPVLTTTDGLWRYRLGDVVEVSGFDPMDGIPVIQFIERRNTVIRFPRFMLTEMELRDSMASVALNMQITMANWTAAIDNRTVPVTVVFFVELASSQVPDLALAPECLLEELTRLNENVGWALACDMFRRPTIRLVRSGTFSEFLQLKLDEGGKIGQVKVPVVLPNPAYVAWFADRVVQEF